MLVDSIHVIFLKAVTSWNFQQMTQTTDDATTNIIYKTFRRRTYQKLFVRRR